MLQLTLDQYPSDMPPAVLAHSVHLTHPVFVPVMGLSLCPFLHAYAYVYVYVYVYIGVKI